MPGTNRRAAQSILAEIGHDMSRFASAAHLANWAGLCPGNNESAGKKRGGKTRFVNRRLKQKLAQGVPPMNRRVRTWAASRTKASYFHGMYQRLKARRGHKRAVLAVAHAMLVTIGHLLSSGSEYSDLGTVRQHQHDPRTLTRNLVQRLEQLGYSITLTPAA